MSLWQDANKEEVLTFAHPISYVSDNMVESGEVLHLCDECIVRRRCYGFQFGYVNATTNGDGVYLATYAVTMETASCYETEWCWYFNGTE